MDRSRSWNGRHAVLAGGIVATAPHARSDVTEEEITGACAIDWRSQAKAVYNERLLEAPKDEPAGEGERPTADEEVDDALYQEAVRVVCEMGRASTSTLQRRLRIGYGRAARLIDIMEKDGIVGGADGTKPREVLKKKDWMRIRSVAEVIASPVPHSEIVARTRQRNTPRYNFDPIWCRDRTSPR